MIIWLNYLRHFKYKIIHNKLNQGHCPLRNVSTSSYSNNSSKISLEFDEKKYLQDLKEKITKSEKIND